MINKERVTVAAFYERFSVFSDERIIDILHNQKDYQEAARNAATQIAIERGLIHSADDLLAPEFQNSQNSIHTFFPSPSNEYHRDRLTGSIFRFLFVFSLLPVVYGVLQYAKGDLTFAALGIGSGVIWFLLAFVMKRTQQGYLAYLLLALVVTAGLFLGFKIIRTTPFRFLDLFMLIVGVLLSVYFLLYAKKLIASR
jgi:uncharacterized membrane protein (UPF0136 family)